MGCDLSADFSADQNGTFIASEISSDALSQLF